MPNSTHNNKSKNQLLAAKQVISKDSNEIELLKARIQELEQQQELIQLKQEIKVLKQTTNHHTQQVKEIDFLGRKLHELKTIANEQIHISTELSLRHKFMLQFIKQHWGETVVMKYSTADQHIIDVIEEILRVPLDCSKMECVRISNDGEKVTHVILM